MALITYEDKQTLNENPTIPDINKCKASDLNEIKQVVNDNYTELGNLEDLETTDKSSLVNAINEVNKPSLTLLYEGEWNSGNITLNDDITNYSMVYILMSGQGTYIPCPILPSELALNPTTGYIRGTGGYTSASTCLTYHFGATYQYSNPKVLTFIACRNVQHLSGGNHNAYAEMTVAKIIGVK